MYPQVETMVEKPASLEARKLIDQVFEGRSVPISRRVILYHYLDSVLRNVPNGASKLQILASLELGLKDYSKEYQDKIYKNPLE